MRYTSIGPKSLYFDTLLRLTLPAEGFLWDDLRKILQGGQRMANVHSGEEILPKASTPEYSAPTLQTDDRRNCDSKDPNVTQSPSGKNEKIAF